LIAIAFHATEPEGERAGVVYRSLRPDVAFRFVSVGEGDGYEVVREEGDPDDAGGVVLIDPFEVPEGEDGEFLAAWDAARATLAQQRGYLGARLHRAAAPARFRFVEVARWSSPLMVSRALERPDFALYQPV
jgi:Antibiotic biosynthesis monooxygenase